MSKRAAIFAAAWIVASCSGEPEAANETAGPAMKEQPAVANPLGLSSSFHAGPLLAADLARMGATASPDGELVYVDAETLAQVYRRDQKLAKRVLFGRRVMVKGRVRSVEPEAGNIYVLIGGAGKRERVTLVPSIDIDDEESNARASRVGALLAVSCGDLSMSEPDDVFLRDCIGFDPA